VTYNLKVQSKILVPAALMPPQVVIFAGLLVLFVPWAMGEDTLAPDVLARLKRATTYIVVDIDGHQASGSGFLYEKAGGRGYIVTNSHVIADKGIAADRIRVVFSSGTATEQVVNAKVLADDPARDLAILEVLGETLPDVITFDEQLQPGELMPVFILGFPFGRGLATTGENPNITVSRGAISSVRKDVYDRTVVLQIDASINPGNSGGPVVTASGQLIGVAVAKLAGTQIGMAIPLHDLRELLLGRIEGVRFRREPGDEGSVKLNVSGRVIDPFQRLKRVTIHMSPLEAITTLPKPNERGEWALVSKEAQAFPLQIDERRLSGDVLLQTVDPQKSRFVVQASYVRGDELQVFGMPAVIDVHALGSGAPVDLAAEGKARPLRSPRPPLPDESWVTGPPPAVSDFTTLSDEDAFFYQPPGTVIEVDRSGTDHELPVGNGTSLFARRVRLPPGEALPSAAWSEDGQRLFLITARGSLREYKLPQLIEVRRLELGGPCSYLGQSREGLVALLNGSRHLAVIDPNTLAIKRYIHVREIDSVACAPGSPLAFVLPSRAASELQIVDLEQGRLVSRVPAADISEQHRNQTQGADAPRTGGAFALWQHPLRLTPDGNFLLAYHSGVLFRLAVAGTNVIFDGSSPRIGRFPQGCVLSTDATYVAVYGGSSGQMLVDHPKLKEGVYVYPLANLDRPSMAIEMERVPAGLVLDIAKRRMFALSSAGLAIYEMGGAPPRSNSILKGMNSPKELLVHPHDRGLLAVYDTHAYWIALDKDQSGEKAERSAKP
jgi:S1-C subfamily serine protease